MTGPPCPPGLLHRDLHDGQILLAPDGTIGLLDADTLARGEPALDLGNLVAHLERFAPDPAAATDALLDGYDPPADTARRLGAYTDAARLRLDCVYAFRP